MYNTRNILRIKYMHPFHSISHIDEFSKQIDICRDWFIDITEAIIIRCIFNIRHRIRTKCSPTLCRFTVVVEKPRQLLVVDVHDGDDDGVEDAGKAAQDAAPAAPVAAVILVGGVLQTEVGEHHEGRDPEAGGDRRHRHTVEPRQAAPLGEARLTTPRHLRKYDDDDNNDDDDGWILFQTRT